MALFDLDGDSRVEIAGVLRGYFAKFPASVTIDEYDRWQDLAYACIEQPYDMAFVSVRNMKGVEAARRVRDHSEETALIYISATDEYATEAWQQQAIHYILKPVEPDQIDQTVQRYTLRELAKLKPVDIEDAPWVAT